MTRLRPPRVSYAATLTPSGVVCRHPHPEECRMPPPSARAVSYAATQRRRLAQERAEPDFQSAGDRFQSP